MKKSWEPIKNSCSMLFIYLIFWIIGLVAIYCQGNDIIYSVQITKGVLGFVILLTIISLFKNTYDTCRFNGYNCFCISLALLFQIIIYGNIFGKNKMIFCVIGYILSIFTGVFIQLFVQEKILLKNKIIREIISMIGVILGSCIIFISSVGKVFTGRRGEILFNAMQVSNDDTKLPWIILLIIACVFGMGSGLSVTNVMLRK